jgi:hypothetical protein
MEKGLSVFSVALICVPHLIFSVNKPLLTALLTEISFDESSGLEVSKITNTLNFREYQRRKNK